MTTLFFRSSSAAEFQHHIGIQSVLFFVQLFITVVHLLDDQVGARVLGQVVIIRDDPAGVLALPLCLVHPQKQPWFICGCMLLLPHLLILQSHATVASFLDADAAQPIAPRALTHHTPAQVRHMALALTAHQLTRLMDLKIQTGQEKKDTGDLRRNANINKCKLYVSSSVKTPVKS